MSLEIRVAGPQDIEALVSFNQAMALETENKVLQLEILRAGVSAIIQDENKGFYLVAEANEQVVGSLMVTTEWSDWRNAQFWWIQSVYIIPSMRRQGIYAKLYERVKTLAEARNNICGFRLYVENDNFIAQKTYESLGMQASHYLMYEE
ncbi:MAG: GNAT family N-acetyltransferase [Paraglaciecola sp.]|nr:GNAT family N-acetyltransferase [Paraglaciecola sp.]NCT47476.1 GNAT family N-acetyltransferase [Paraglaciecola sp.]